MIAQKPEPGERCCQAQRYLSLIMPEGPSQHCTHVVVLGFEPRQQQPLVVALQLRLRAFGKCEVPVSLATADGIGFTRVSQPLLSILSDCLEQVIGSIFLSTAPARTCTTRSDPARAWTAGSGQNFPGG